MTAGVAFKAFALPGTTGTFNGDHYPCFCPFMFCRFDLPLPFTLTSSVIATNPRCHLEPQGEISCSHHPP